MRCYGVTFRLKLKGWRERERERSKLVHQGYGTWLRSENGLFIGNKGVKNNIVLLEPLSVNPKGILNLTAFDRLLGSEYIRFFMTNAPHPAGSSFSLRSLVVQRFQDFLNYVVRFFYRYLTGSYFVVPAASMLQHQGSHIHCSASVDDAVTTDLVSFRRFFGQYQGTLKP